MAEQASEEDVVQYTRRKRTWMGMFATGLGRTVRRLRDTARRFEGIGDADIRVVRAGRERERKALLDELDARLPGRSKADLIDDDAFWAVVEQLQALHAPKSKLSAESPPAGQAAGEQAEVEQAPQSDAPQPAEEPQSEEPQSEEPQSEEPRQEPENEPSE